jgi:hypothetical protein
MIRVFTYNLFYRLLYRYGNIPVTIILFIYLLAFSANISKGYFYILFIFITAALIYKINRFYLELYKIFPAKIKITDEEIICADFFCRKKKEIVIKYEDIGKLEGGIFQKKFSGLMKIYDKHNNYCVGFFQKLTDARIFETILLNKVPKEVYDSVSKKMGLTAGIN